MQSQFKLREIVAASMRLIVCGLTISLGLAACHSGQAQQQNKTISTAEPRGPQVTDSYLTDDRDNAISKTTFLADDKPIFLMLAATGAAKTPIRAVWMTDAPVAGQQAVLNEQQSVSSSDNLTTSFSERPPASGWKPGAYHVDVYFGDNIVHTEHFKVVATAAELDGSLADQNAAPGTPASETAAPETPLPTGGPLKPAFTPLPTPTDGIGDAEQANDPDTPLKRDSGGRILVGINDSFQLHTSRRCHDASFTVYINDKRQGIYAVPDMTSEISLDFNPGPNSIKITWNAPNATRECQMAVALSRHKRVHTLATIHVFRLSPPHGAVGLGVNVQ